MVSTAPIPKIPHIPEDERTPTVVELLQTTHLLREMVQELRDEIARSKGLKGKPKIKPSKLESNERGKEGTKGGGKRAGSRKRSKTRELEIHETVVVPPPGNVPPGSRFKGYEDYTVQDIVFKVHNTRFRLERWLTPTGDYVGGELPVEVADGHFGPELVCHILHQYHHAHVTQPLLLEELREKGVDISSGQLSNIITKGKEAFHAEKDGIRRTGLEVSRYVNVDDTGARHRGRSGYCTHIGNELFAWFESTDTKSRLNFLTLLRGDRTDYTLNIDALAHMRSLKLPRAHLERLAQHAKRTLETKEEWEATLEDLGITADRHVRIATEGALLGTVLEQAIHPELVVISDDAGQFRVLIHALCWIHAERSIHRLVAFSDDHRQALEEVRSEIWDFYDELKAYRESPTEEKRPVLEGRFDEIFSRQTCYASLNKALRSIAGKKSELLLVLERPEIPLHNNMSEGDIREYVKKRKISGSTRSAAGRRCRDTFTSLKKTCRKLGLSFWEYLRDRIWKKGRIPLLGDLIRQRARAPSS